MNFNLKPHPFLAHFIPGCFAAVIMAMAHCSWSYTGLNPRIANISNVIVFASLIGILILGECIDAIRDIIEHLLDLRENWRMEWNHVLAPEKTEDKLYVFENYYFTYYVFCANSFLAVLVAVMGCQIDRLETMKCKALVALSLMAVVLLTDAILLRCELVRDSRIKGV